MRDELVGCLTVPLLIVGPPLIGVMVGVWAFGTVGLYLGAVAGFAVVARIFKV